MDRRARPYRTLLGLVVVAGLEAHAQTWPAKPVRILACEPGGTCDLSARLLGQALTERLGQQVIVENRGAASGLVAVQALMKSPADGYTLLFHTSTIWLLPFLQENVGYEPLRDLQPVSMSVMAPNVLVVHPSLPVKNVRDLIALAHRRPGELNYGAGASGAAPHMAAELFKSMAKADILRIAHRGTGAAVIDLIAGRVQLMFPVVGAISPHVKSGKLRALAVTSAKPSDLFPGLPTIADSGLPGYESVATLGLFAAAGTPAAVVQKLHQEIAAVLGVPEIKARFFASGIETVAGSPEAFADRIRNEMAVLGKVIRQAGIRAD
jgi:tripartite-type tricarboxylate transporter receptor subunit TctC